MVAISLVLFWFSFDSHGRLFDSHIRDNRRMWTKGRVRVCSIPEGIAINFMKMNQVACWIFSLMLSRLFGWLRMGSRADQRSLGGTSADGAET